jgi:hypothetical protein
MLGPLALSSPPIFMVTERHEAPWSAPAENQPRRNEEREEGSEKTFVFFVSSWLIFILSHASLTSL